MRRIVITAGALLMIAVGALGIAVQVSNWLLTGTPVDPVRSIMGVFPALLGVLLLVKRHKGQKRQRVAGNSYASVEGQAVIHRSHRLHRTRP